MGGGGCFAGGLRFSATGLNTLLVSLLPNVARQSSSRTFLGDTSIFEGLRWSFVCSCSACSRCSHFANAAFFFTGDSDRSRFALVVVRVKKGSLPGVASFPDNAPRLYPEFALLLLIVGCLLAIVDRSVSLLFERVLICRSGDDLVGL